jgi:hypothetical protein
MAHWRKNHQSEANHLKSADLYDDAASTKSGRDVYLSPVVQIERVSVDTVKSREKPKGERRYFACGST